MKIRKAVILSGSAIVRKGLRTILNDYHMLQVAGEAGDLDQLCILVDETDPDFIFAGTEFMQDEESREMLRSSCPPADRTRLIAVGRAMPAAGVEYLDINMDSQELATRLEEILHSNVTPAPKEDQLSEREINVLREVALGQTNKEVGDKLFISTHTVITHRKNITRKLGIRTVSGLTVYAIINGIVSMEDIQTAEKHENDEEI